MVAIIANIVVAALIIIMIYGAIRTLKKPDSKKGSKDCCNYCHDSNCDTCKK
ncbi:MAG: hypothetical protein M0P10_01140 [Sphaerochaetaceae bacterium]|nr:hypothetical protein [Sphaerochaetaceae bacterium]